MKLSDRIKTLREAAKWTQFELASKAGVSQQLIAKIERGKVRESRKLPKIAAAFGLTVDELLAITPPDRPGRGFDLTQDERALVEAYRTATRSGKEAIMGAATGVHTGSDKPGQLRRIIEDRPIVAPTARKRSRFRT